MDKVSPRQRHANMAAIHSSDTRPEMIVRRWLHSRGFRYRLNHRGLPGHPDIGHAISVIMMPLHVLAGTRSSSGNAACVLLSVSRLWSHWNRLFIIFS